MLIVLILILFVAVIAAISYGVLAGWKTFGASEQAAWRIVGYLGGGVVLVAAVCWLAQVPYVNAALTTLEPFSGLLAVVVAAFGLGLAVHTARQQSRRAAELSEREGRRAAELSEREGRRTAELSDRERRWNIQMRYLDSCRAAMKEPFWGLQGDRPGTMMVNTRSADYENFLAARRKEPDSPREPGGVPRPVVIDNTALLKVLGSILCNCIFIQDALPEEERRRAASLLRVSLPLNIDEVITEFGKWGEELAVAGDTDRDRLASAKLQRTIALFKWYMDLDPQGKPKGPGPGMPDEG